jgi:hypothetical protein
VGIGVTAIGTVMNVQLRDIVYRVRLRENGAVERVGIGGLGCADGVVTVDSEQGGCTCQFTAPADASSSRQVAQLGFSGNKKLNF